MTLGYLLLALVLAISLNHGNRPGRAGACGAVASLFRPGREMILARGESIDLLGLQIASPDLADRFMGGSLGRLAWPGVSRSPGGSDHPASDRGADATLLEQTAHRSALHARLSRLPTSRYTEGRSSRHGYRQQISGQSGPVSFGVESPTRSCRHRPADRPRSRAGQQTADRKAHLRRNSQRASRPQACRQY